MAALATSQLAISCTGFGVTDRSAPSMFRHGFQGLRPRNPVDTLSMRTSARAAPKQQRRVHRGSRRFHSVVVCATNGMNVVFVGAEMAPWSKTGGLGDVLGGLPPAMAVSSHPLHRVLDSCMCNVTVCALCRRMDTGSWSFLPATTSTTTPGTRALRLRCVMGS